MFWVDREPPVPFWPEQERFEDSFAEEVKPGSDFQGPWESAWGGEDGEVNSQEFPVDLPEDSKKFAEGEDRSTTEKVHLKNGKAR
jgi:hypothetical protein